LPAAIKNTLGTIPARDWRFNSFPRAEWLLVNVVVRHIAPVLSLSRCQVERKSGRIRRDMKTSIIFAIVAVVLTCFALPQWAQATSDDQSARDEAVRWVGLMDGGQYRQAYETQPPRVKAASAGRDYFVRWMQTRRVPLGRVCARSFYNRRYYHNAIGWPDGNYVQIYFKTSFEHKAAGWERVILTKETGRWQPAKYNLW
jgi:Protein of unknown function (DUF4019)